jgi:uncharacterized protein
MTWHDLLFLHWPVRADRLREFVPPGLEIETFDASAWLGVVPFRMTGVRHRLLPPIPGLSAFPELNVRTYVRAADGRPGIWFFSLDAPSRIAVRTARATYRLAYMDAAMVCETDGDGAVRYDLRRTGPHTSLAVGAARTPEARFCATYRPLRPLPEPDPLARFLTDRYCLYAFGRGRLYRAEIDHAPWPLHLAHAEVTANTMGAALGIDLPGPATLAHFASRLAVRAWRLRAIA